MEQYLKLYTQYLQCIILHVDPVFMARLVTLLSSEVLTDKTISSALSALKEEWMK